jgi:hypothetical protein
MKDYQNQIDGFTNNADKKKIEKYLEKYWLEKPELNEVWSKIKNTIFNSTFNAFPDPVYNVSFDTIVRKGGCILYRDELELLQSCMRTIGDKYLLIIEDFDETNPPHTSGPPYRFKFPVDISWEAILSGAELSLLVFQMPERNYFIFGDSGQWGKYAGNDYESPLEIIGFNRKYSELFHSKFKIPKEDIEDLKEWTASYGMKLPGVDKV